jgi:diadenylate cyclase
MIEVLKIGFLSFNIIDLIDVLIVAALFLGLYRALKNTIAVQILFGMVLLIFLSFITEMVNLRALNWILKTISSVWLIAFIVLFQPELRRLLLLITRSYPFKFLMKSKILETLDEVAEAAVEMSEKHIGALIVFSKSQNVQMTVDTGLQIQATVSKELLLSIFNTKSPLHDGAVIIEDQTLIAARCVLPLSSVTKYGTRNLGTRHRAGLGLSEQIDAVILIVSEETGSISIADTGSLQLDIPRNELLVVLNQKFQTEVK